MPLARIFDVPFLPFSIHSVHTIIFVEVAQFDLDKDCHCGDHAPRQKSIQSQFSSAMHNIMLLS